MPKIFLVEDPFSHAKFWYLLILRIPVPRSNRNKWVRMTMFEEYCGHGPTESMCSHPTVWSFTWNIFSTTSILYQSHESVAPHGLELEESLRIRCTKVDSEKICWKPSPVLPSCLCSCRYHKIVKNSLEIGLIQKSDFLRFHSKGIQTSIEFLLGAICRSKRGCFFPKYIFANLKFLKLIDLQSLQRSWTHSSQNTKNKYLSCLITPPSVLRKILSFEKLCNIL